MGRKKQEYIKYITEYDTNHFSCNNCPAKLFNNNEEYIRAGVGYVGSKYMIVLPTYISMNKNKFNEFVNLIVNKYKELTGLSIFSIAYITPVIKCFCDTNNYNIKSKVLEKCAIKTISELVQHKEHEILIYLGDSKEIDIFNTYRMVKYHIDCPFTIFDNEEQQNKFINKLFNILIL